MKCKECTYSREMNQEYPRKCVVCGEPEPSPLPSMKKRNANPLKQKIEDLELGVRLAMLYIITTNPDRYDIKNYFTKEQLEQMSEEIEEKEVNDELLVHLTSLIKP